LSFAAKIPQKSRRNTVEIVDNPRYNFNKCKSHVEKCNVKIMKFGKSHVENCKSKKWVYRQSVVSQRVVSETKANKSKKINKSCTYLIGGKDSVQKIQIYLNSSLAL